MRVVGIIIVAVISIVSIIIFFAIISVIIIVVNVIFIVRSSSSSSRNSIMKVDAGGIISIGCIGHSGVSSAGSSNSSGGGSDISSSSSRRWLFLIGRVGVLRGRGTPKEDLSELAQDHLTSRASQ